MNYDVRILLLRITLIALQLEVLHFQLVKFIVNNTF